MRAARRVSAPRCPSSRRPSAVRISPRILESEEAEPPGFSDEDEPLGTARRRDGSRSTGGGPAEAVRSGCSTGSYLPQPRFVATVRRRSWTWTPPRRRPNVHRRGTLPPSTTCASARRRHCWIGAGRVGGLAYRGSNPRVKIPNLRCPAEMIRPTCDHLQCCTRRIPLRSHHEFVYGLNELKSAHSVRRPGERAVNPGASSTDLILWNGHCLLASQRSPAWVRMRWHSSVPTNPQGENVQQEVEPYGRSRPYKSVLVTGWVLGALVFAFSGLYAPEDAQSAATQTVNPDDYMGNDSCKACHEQGSTRTSRARRTPPPPTAGSRPT